MKLKTDITKCLQNGFLQSSLNEDEKEMPSMKKMGKINIITFLSGLSAGPLLRSHSPRSFSVELFSVTIMGRSYASNFTAI